MDFLHVFHRAAVEYRELGAVDLYQAVVYSEGVKGSQCVLHRADPDISLAQHGATLRVHHVLRHGFYHRHPVEVYSLYLVTSVLSCWIERHRKAQSCVQAFAAKGETPLYCVLFCHTFIYMEYRKVYELAPSSFIFCSSSLIVFCISFICLYISGSLFTMACERK